MAVEGLCGLSNEGGIAQGHGRAGLHTGSRKRMSMGGSSLQQLRKRGGGCRGKVTRPAAAPRVHFIPPSIRKRWGWGEYTDSSIGTVAAPHLCRPLEVEVDPIHVPRLGGTHSIQHLSGQQRNQEDYK